MANDSIARLVRAHQEEAEGVGELFRTMHELGEYLAAHLFADVELPPLYVRFERIRSQRSAEYRPVDGSWLQHVVALDPFKMTDGRQAAESYAHEFVHHYQWCTGKVTDADLERNAHDEEFFDIMAELGIAVDESTGLHRGYIGDVWEEWVQMFEEESGHVLSELVLPGPQEPKRKLHKWQCLRCQFSFRTRRTDVDVWCNGAGDDEDDRHALMRMEMVE